MNISQRVETNKARINSMAGEIREAETVLADRIEQGDDSAIQRAHQRIETLEVEEKRLRRELVAMKNAEELTAYAALDKLDDSQLHAELQALKRTVARLPTDSPRSEHATSRKLELEAERSHRRNRKQAVGSPLNIAQ